MSNSHVLFCYIGRREQKIRIMRKHRADRMPALTLSPQIIKKVKRTCNVRKDIIEYCISHFCI